MTDHHATRNRNAAKSEATDPPVESFDDDLIADEIMSEDEAKMWVDQTSRDVAGLFIPLTAFPDPK